MPSVRVHSPVHRRQSANNITGVRCDILRRPMRPPPPPHDACPGHRHGRAGYPRYGRRTVAFRTTLGRLTSFAIDADASNIARASVVSTTTERRASRPPSDESTLKTRRSSRTHYRTVFVADRTPWS